MKRAIKSSSSSRLNDEKSMKSNDVFDAEAMKKMEIGTMKRTL
jgi:hypothetical protein